jgi:hypothetical protein
VPNVIPRPPALPESIKRAFPEMRQWEEDMQEWATGKLGIVINRGPI